MGVTSEPDEYTDVAVVMITRNEERAVGKVIADCRAALPGARVYVIDGSTDATPQIAREAGAIVVGEPGGGFGPALSAALSTPTEPIVVTVDADDTYPADQLPVLVGMVREGADVAGGSRIRWSGTSNMPIANWGANLIFNLCASAVAGRWIKDVHSGMRAYRREVLHGFKWRNRGPAFPVDLLMFPIMAGYRVTEVVISYDERIGESTLEKWPSTKATFWRIFTARGAASTCDTRS